MIVAGCGSLFTDQLEAGRAHPPENKRRVTHQSEELENFLGLVSVAVVEPRSHQKFQHLCVIVRPEPVVSPKWTLGFSDSKIFPVPGEIDRPVHVTNQKFRRSYDV